MATAAILGLATVAIPITVIQVITPIADPTTIITDMTVTTDTVGMTGFLRSILQMVAVNSLRVLGVPQLQDRVEIQTADRRLLPRADLFLGPQRPGRNWRPIVLAQAPHPEISPVATQATPWLARAEGWRRRVAARSQGPRHMRRTRGRQLRQLDKMAVRVLASHRQVELTVP